MLKGEPMVGESGENNADTVPGILESLQRREHEANDFLTLPFLKAGQIFRRPTISLVGRLTIRVTYTVGGVRKLYMMSRISRGKAVYILSQRSRQASLE